MIFDVQGALAPVFTPFDDKGQINYHVIPEYMEHLSKHRISGILVGGTTGEGMTLDVNERIALLEAWLAAARPHGVKVIVQVGGGPFPDILELAKHAERVNADAIMSLPELYYKPKTVKQLVSYLMALSEAAPTRPLLYYHFPMMTGVEVNMPQLFSELTSKIPNFRGMKADLEVAMQVTDQLIEGQKIFIANHYIAPAVLMGSNSSIATVTNIFPGLVHDIINAVNNGKVLEAKILQIRMNKIVDIVASQGDFVPSMKATMELVTGIKVGSTRTPLTKLSQEDKNCLKNNLKSLGINIY